MGDDMGWNCQANVLCLAKGLSAPRSCQEDPLPQFSRLTLMRNWLENGREARSGPPASDQPPHIDKELVGKRQRGQVDDWAHVLKQQEVRQVGELLEGPGRAGVACSG